MVAFVEGTRALDSTNNRWIPYKTRSDALIAQLSLSRGFTIEEVDIVLDIIHHPSFDPKEVSFRKTPDIYVPVAQERAVTRNASLSTLSKVSDRLDLAGMPEVVLHLVVQSIADMMPDPIEYFYGDWLGLSIWDTISRTCA